MKQLSTTPQNSFKPGKIMAAPMHRDSAREKVVRIKACDVSVRLSLGNVKIS